MLLIIDICSSLAIYYQVRDGLGLEDRGLGFVLTDLDLLNSGGLGLEDRGLGLGFVLADLNLFNSGGRGLEDRGLGFVLADLDLDNYFTLPQLRSKFGERAFSHAGPSAWNSLPDSIAMNQTLQSFGNILKLTFLFSI